MGGCCPLSIRPSSSHLPPDQPQSPGDGLEGEAAGPREVISCSKQMAHFAQNVIFFFWVVIYFLSCPEWPDAASRRITKLMLEPPTCTRQ